MFDGKQPVLGSDVAADDKMGIGLSTDTGDETTSTNTRSNLISNLELKNPAATNVQIVATLGKSANKDIHNATVEQHRSTDGVWTCHIMHGTATGFKNKFVPSGCENNK